MAVAPFLPRWTKRVFTKTGGRDPLGLSRVSGNITDFMMPGITTITPRARYFSFFCWALENISSEEHPNTYEDFKTALRRREAAVALATTFAGHEGLMHGAEEAQAELASPSYPDKYSTDFQVLPSNPLGGYGQYYSGSLYRLALTQRDEKGIDHLSNDLARTLGQRYGKSIEGSPYFQDRLFGSASIKEKVLEESAPTISVDGLDQPQAAGERQVLVDLFLALGGPRNEDDLNRRNSLALILDVVRSYQELGVNPRFNDLDASVLYGPHYFGVLTNDGSPLGSWVPPDRLEQASAYWRQFCLQEYLTVALERLLSVVLEIAGNRSAGVTEKDLIGSILQPGFSKSLSEQLEMAVETPRELVVAFGMDHPPSSALSEGLRQSYPFGHPCSEESLHVDFDGGSPQSEAAQAILILSVVYGKWRGISEDPAFYQVMTKAGPELCAKTIFPYLDSWFDPRVTWEAALGELVGRLVLDQHDRIMYEKRRLDSTWFSRAGGRFLKDQDYEPHRRNSRFQNAVRILCDIGMLEREEPEDRLRVTSAGLVQLSRILEA